MHDWNESCRPAGKRTCSAADSLGGKAWQWREAGGPSSLRGPIVTANVQGPRLSARTEGPAGPSAAGQRHAGGAAEQTSVIATPASQEPVCRGTLTLALPFQQSVMHDVQPLIFPGFVVLEVCRGHVCCKGHIRGSQAGRFSHRQVWVVLANRHVQRT